MLSDRIGVLFHGRVLEEGTGTQVLGNPQHAYTRQLIAAVPPLKAPPARALSDEPILGRRAASGHLPQQSVHARHLGRTMRGGP